MLPTYLQMGPDISFIHTQAFSEGQPQARHHAGFRGSGMKGPGPALKELTSKWRRQIIIMWGMCVGWGL